ncbi:MAG: putative nudix hydrolase YeaB [Bacteroidetes bacterium]|nr:putative nudix hydrolase YeaB [Bacteroidota bacterium]
MKQFINNLIQKLKEPLPGEEAQFLMAPMGRRKLREDNNETNFRKSAVMILICRDKNEDLFIPLTERFAYEGAHSGQVSLPGGKFDETDKDLIATAYRECREEIGIEQHIELIGCLSTLYIPVSNFMVQPVVAVYNAQHVAFTPHEREVKHIAKLYLRDLLNEKIIKKGDIELQNGVKIKAPYFEIEGLKVWGATAMILSEFKALLQTTF